MSKYTYLYSDAQASQVVYPYTTIEAVEGLDNQIASIKNSIGKDINISCPATGNRYLGFDANDYY